jgi:prolyl oligopeptidase
MDAKHLRRLRELWRSGGWPYRDTIELELLALGLVEEVSPSDPARLCQIRVSRAGIEQLHRALEHHRSARSRHAELVDKTAQWLLAQDRLVFREFSCLGLGGEGWRKRRPDLFSVRYTTREAMLCPQIHEIKVNRSDLLADLARPDKGLSYTQMAGQCWYVLGNGSKKCPIADPSEVPERFGVLLDSANGLVVARAPPPRRANGLGFPVWMALARAVPLTRVDLAVASQGVLGAGGPGGLGCKDLVHDDPAHHDRVHDDSVHHDRVHDDSVHHDGVHHDSFNDRGRHDLLRSGLISLWILAAVFFTALSTGVLAFAPPPAKPATTRYHGMEVQDPYRWLENTANPEVAQWMKDASAHATQTLAARPGRERLFAAMLSYDSAVSARVARLAREEGDQWFFERRAAREDQFKLMLRQGLAGADRVLVDPEQLQRETGKPHAINYYTPSPGGRFVAYGVSAQGSEAAVLHLLDTRSGKRIGAPIDRADFGNVNWSPDGRYMLFTRLQALKPGMPLTAKYQRSQTLLLERGAPLSHARPVFGVGTPGTRIADAEIPSAGFTQDGRWALGVVFNGTQSEISLYLAPARSLYQGRPRWRRLLSPDDKVTNVAYMHDTLYLVSHRDAPRSKVLEVPLADFDLARARELVAASERVVTAVAAAADALYIEARDGNIKRLFRHRWRSGLVEEVKLPTEGSFSLSGEEGGMGAADPRFPGVLLDLQSWNRAPRIYAIDANGVALDTGLQPAGPHDAPAHVVVTEVQVPSHDGVLVPMSIIHHKDVQLDGTNPTLLYGYASYGSTEEPYFSLSRLAWLDAGGVFAVANPRGSGVYGQDWYKAGFQASKPNSWKDFIACAEWLIERRWTSPQRLGILGGSAGGILVGRAMTERPELFAAVIPAVGALDMLRAEETPNGIPNIPEFGSHLTASGFKALLAMSTYHQIRDGVKYPAVLLTHGVNDPRVEVWHSTKTAARLMAATASGKPVLLRLDYQAGHGVGSTKRQQLQERTDMYAFLLWQMGVPGY